MHKLIVPLTVAILGVCTAANSAPRNTTEIIAHRGASHDAPENTLASVKLAWQKKADAVEIDIHQSKDGKIIVSHDSTTLRMTGKDLVIKDSDSSLLRTLDAGSVKDKQFTGERLPFLEEVIKILPRGKNLFVEIKCGKEALPAVQKIFKDSRKTRQLRVIGFDLETIAAFKQLMPEIPVYWLRGANSYDLKLIETAKSRNLDGLDLYNQGLNKEFADATKAAGLKLYAWTVDDPSEAKQLIDIGVNGITTNRPDLIREKAL